MVSVVVVVRDVRQRTRGRFATVAHANYVFSENWYKDDPQAQQQNKNKQQ